MTVTRLSEEKNAKDPKSPGHERDSGFTTDSTVLANDHDTEKGKTKETVQTDAVEAQQLEQLEVQGTQLYVLIGAVLLGAFSMAINGTILGTALPAITAEFQTVDDIGWYATAYLIANCAMAPLVGKLFKLFRLKLLFIIMESIFLIGSVVGAQAGQSNTLIVARTIAGIGGSGIITGGQTIIAAVVPISKRSSFNGLILSTFALGQATGPLIGGALTERGSWRWCFYFNAPLCVLVIAAFAFVVKLPVDSLCKEKLTFREKIRQLDLAGFLIFLVAVILFLLGLQWGGTQYPWSDGKVIALMVLGLLGFVLLGLWFWRRGEKALIPPRLLKDRINIMITITSFVQSGATVTSLYWLPIWFQSIIRASPFHSGVLILPLIVSQLISSIICGILVQKTGYYLPEVIGGNILVAIGAGLTSTFTPVTPTGSQIGFQILLGAGRGLVLQLLVTAMQANVSRRDASVASAYCMFSQYLGSALFSSLAKTIFTSSIPGAVAKFAPFLNKDPHFIINMGAAELPEHFRGPQLRDVTNAYNAAIVNVFYLQLAAALGAFCTGWGMGWRNLKTVRQGRLTDEAESSENRSSDQNSPKPANSAAGYPDNNGNSIVTKAKEVMTKAYIPHTKNSRSQKI